MKIKIGTSFTTRPMRTGEKEGIDYFFITNEEFLSKEKNGELYEKTSYEVGPNKVWRYALAPCSISENEHTLITVNPHGLRQLLNSKIKEKIVILYFYSDLNTRIERYLERDYSNMNKEKELCSRLVQDEKDFADFTALATSSKNPYYCFYNNDTKDIDELKDDIVKVIDSFDDSKVFCLVGKCATGKTTIEKKFRRNENE